ncbi:MAG: mitochondrial fission ELM1 family protein [Paracoccaceae bacterium]
MAKALTLWVLTDGRAGHLAQAMGLAEAIARARPVEIETRPVTMKPWAIKLPATVLHGLGRAISLFPRAALDYGGADLRWPWPDCVISAGRRTAPVAAWMRRQHGVTAIQLLDPKIAPNAFDAVLVPGHDSLQGANVHTSLGALNRITSQLIDNASVAIADQVSALAPPRIGVLIGGPSGSAEFSEADAARLGLALENIATDHTLLITTSRRTPPVVKEMLSKALGDRAAIWSPDGAVNPYPGMLGHVENVLVTEDSVNMASEAASCGLPVHVFPISSVASKLAQFHEDLSAYGASRRFTGALEQWEYTPLAEADRLANDLIRRGII